MGKVDLQALINRIWLGEDQCYVGTCPGLMLGGVHEDPLPEPTSGKEYSGKFVVRVGKELHRVLALNALCSGESLNSHCVNPLQEDLAPLGRN